MVIQLFKNFNLLQKALLLYYAESAHTYSWQFFVSLWHCLLMDLFFSCWTKCPGQANMREIMQVMREFVLICHLSICTQFLATTISYKILFWYWIFIWSFTFLLSSLSHILFCVMQQLPYCHLSYVHWFRIMTTHHTTTQHKTFHHLLTHYMDILPHDNPSRANSVIIQEKQ